MNSLLLAEIREHSAKSISLYKKLLKAGINKEEARLTLIKKLDQWISMSDRLENE